MGLLAEKGFTLDSSLPSHRGVPPLPQLLNAKKQTLLRIPVTVDPIPVLSLKHHLPYYRFLVCNLETLKQFTNDEFLDYVTRITSIQVALGCLPHIVVLCHSWEFRNPPPNTRRFKYCSELNFEFLQKLIRLLEQNFSLKHVTMSRLAQRLIETNLQQ
jgi:hypothetical protein